MSILLPFEVLTTNGWKAAEKLEEQEFVACMHHERGLEYRKIRQLLLYASNFLFTPYSNGTFSFCVCEGRAPVPFPDKPSKLSHFLKACAPVESEEYDPDPVMQFSGNSKEVEGLQIQAIVEGISAVVEHLPDKLNIRTIADPVFWPMVSFRPEGHMALSVSCYETEPTRLVVRLAMLGDAYKTMCIIV
jgi:hypothetical protein